MAAPGQPTDPPAPIGGGTLVPVETTNDCGCCGGQSGSGTVTVPCCPETPLGRRLRFEVVGCNNAVWFFEYRGMYASTDPGTEIFAVPPGFTGTIAHIWTWADGDCLQSESLCPDDYPLANHVPQNFTCNVAYLDGVETGAFNWGDAFGPATLVSCDSILAGTPVSDQCEPFLQVWAWGTSVAVTCDCLVVGLGGPATLVITEA